jgi:phosphoribosyl-dephospho-CoA transferase
MKDEGMMALLLWRNDRAKIINNALFRSQRQKIYCVLLKTTTYGVIKKNKKTKTVTTTVIINYSIISRLIL